MGKKRKKTKKIKRRRLYPLKLFVPLYWIAVGFTFILVWVLPIRSLGFYIDYVEGMVLGLALWIPFMVGAILYSNYFQRQGIRICSNCGKYAHKGRKYCEKCGARVFWECPKCGAKGSRGLDFCKECGQSLKVVTFARQIEFEESPRNEEKPSKKGSGLVVTGSVVQFCPSCGAEVSEDLTHCSICGTKFEQ